MLSNLSSKSSLVSRLSKQIGTCSYASEIHTVDSGSGFFNAVLGTSKRVTTPLTEEFPGSSKSPFVVKDVEKAETKMTTLSNGVRVISEDTYGLTSSVGCFVQTGSMYENTNTLGCTIGLEQAAFRGTSSRTAFRTVREMESIGAGAMYQGNRDTLLYSVNSVKTNVDAALEILCDSVANPVFDGSIRDIKTPETNDDTRLQEALHATGYKGALARPLIPEEQVPVSHEALSDFHKENFSGDRIVLAGSGCSHELIVEAAEQWLSDLPSGAAPVASSSYVGGSQIRCTDQASPTTNIAMAFEYKGGWQDVKGSVALTILNFLLGGGGSFSSGGPGKGMHSRLYTQVLNSSPWMYNCSAFNNTYDNTGLFGISALVDSHYSAQAVDKLTLSFLSLAGNITDEELNRAKNATLGAVLGNLESSHVIMEDSGRQVLTFGERKHSEALVVEEIKNLTKNDMETLVKDMLQSPLTYVANGNTSNLPRGDIAARFN